MSLAQPMLGSAISASKTRVLRLGGGTISVLLSGEQTQHRVEAFDFFVPPGHPGVSAHVHDRADEFFAILDGEATFTIDGERIVVPAGSNIAVPRGTAHAWKNESDRPLRLIVSFSPAVGMEAYFTELAEIVKTSWPPTGEVFAALWGRCDTRPA